MSLLLQILEVYPEVNREWLIFGEGEMKGSPDRCGLRYDVGTKPHGPITKAVAEVEKALSGVDELIVIKAAIGKLDTMHQVEAQKRDGYGSQLDAREPQIHADMSDAPANACGINGKPPTDMMQYFVPGSTKPKR